MDERNLNNNSYPIDSEEYIDLKLYFNLFLRNKKFVFIFTTLITFISIIIAYTTEREWRGKFQIVLSQEKSNVQSPRLLSAGILSGLSSQYGASSDVNTQVEILKSNSVLKPAFELYKANNLPINENNNLRFDNWSESKLNINLKEFTNVLNIDFLDPDKELIVKVLNKISEEYQSFSLKEKEKGLKKSINFLESQIEEFKERVVLAMRKVDKYSKDNNIFLYIDPSPSSISTTSSPSSISTTSNSNSIITTNIEFTNRKLLSEITKINDELERINKISINKQSSLATIFPNNEFLILVKESNFLDRYISDINSLEKDIDLKKTYYTDKDEKLKFLLELKFKKLNDLKKVMITNLKSQVLQKNAELKNNFREDSKIFKFKELVRNSRRDEITLSALEENIRSLRLELQKKQDPWKIITDPIVGEFPVKPIKRQYAFKGLILGLISSLFASILYEKKKSIIYNKEEIKKLLGIEKVCNVSNKNNSDDIENILLFIEGNLNLKKNDTFSIVYIGEEQKEFSQFLIKGISNFYQKENILITDNFREGFKNQNQILVSFCGRNKLKTFEEFKTKINLLNAKPSGLIVIMED